MAPKKKNAFVHRGKAPSSSVCSTTTLIVLALVTFVGGLIMHSTAIRGIDGGGGLDSRSLNNVETLRARFATADAPAAEPEPTLPPEAHAAALDSSSSSSSAPISLSPDAAFIQHKPSSLRSEEESSFKAQPHPGKADAAAYANAVSRPQKKNHPRQLSPEAKADKKRRADDDVVAEALQSAMKEGAEAGRNLGGLAPLDKKDNDGGGTSGGDGGDIQEVEVLGRYRKKTRVLDDDVLQKAAKQQQHQIAEKGLNPEQGVALRREGTSASSSASSPFSAAAKAAVQAGGGHGTVFEHGNVDHSREGAQVFNREDEVAAMSSLTNQSAPKAFSADWLVDPHGAEHARYRSMASGSLLGAMRRHHLVNDFVPRKDEWYTSQSCADLLPYFADVLPRSRNMIRTMEYSSAQLKEQVHALKSRNLDLDTAHLKRKTAEAAAAAGAAASEPAGGGGMVSRLFGSRGGEGVAVRQGVGAGLPSEIETVLFPFSNSGRRLLGLMHGLSSRSSSSNDNERNFLNENHRLHSSPPSLITRHERDRDGAGVSGGALLGDAVAAAAGGGGGGRRLLGGGGILAMGGRGHKGKKPKDGVSFNEQKKMWVAAIDVGQSRFSLGTFESKDLAQAAYDKEFAAAKALGYGAFSDADSSSGGEGGDCEQKLKKVYFQIHEVMLDTRQLEVVTASLRTTIANLHDRNRVLEREFDLSPAALRWLAAPLFIDKAKRSTTDTSAAAAQLIEGAKAQHRLQLRSEEGKGEGEYTQQHLQVDGVVSDDALPADGGGGGGSLVHNPTVLKAMREYKNNQLSGSSHDGSHSVGVGVVSVEVFAERKEPCSQEYLSTQKRANLEKDSHRCLTPYLEKKARDLHGPQHQAGFPDYIHFVHVPKAGGTSFTKVLRRMMCTRNNATESQLDCCAVGWCDWQKGITCQNIHGCTNHIPRMHKWLNRPLPSVTIIRNPVTRFVSAWHYRCHHPNYDCFNVRPDFKLVRNSNGKASKFSFKDYCDMSEYQNILIKMLVKDKFPYGDYGPLGSVELAEGREVVDKFVFVGMNEMYDTSMVLLASLLHIPLMPSDFDKERTANRPEAYKDFMKNLAANTTLRVMINEANSLDIALYEHARLKFCAQLKKSPAALLHPMIETELDSESKNVCLDLWGDLPAAAGKQSELVLVPGRGATEAAAAAAAATAAAVAAGKGVQ